MLGGHKVVLEEIVGGVDFWLRTEGRKFGIPGDGFTGSFSTCCGGTGVGFQCAAFKEGVYLGYEYMMEV